jgi:NTE family protein
MRVALVFSGGIGLGAYQAGAYAALHGHDGMRPDWLAGASIGAVNAAVIAGNAPQDRVARLNELWMVDEPWRTIWHTGAPPAAIPWRYMQSWTSVVQARLLGQTGYFRPRFMAGAFEPPTSFYDLAPLAARIEKLVDFGRLNGGEVRFAVAATDIESGSTALFDTGRGERIGVDHLLASCGFLPDFAPVEIGGRLLGDGGLSVNAPLEAVLHDDRDATERVCFVLDLFARDGARPTGIETAFARRRDLLFGNQTCKRIEAFQRESALRDRLAALAERLPAKAKQAAGMLPGRTPVRAILHLSYRSVPDEAGPEKPFDFSPASVADRWREGELDMAEALLKFAAPPRSSHGCVVSAIRRAPDAST